MMKSKPQIRLNLLLGLSHFLAIFTWLMLVDNRVFRFDASTYYRLANSFDAGYGFSLANFPRSLRGVVFPLILHGFNSLTDLMLGDRIYGWRLMIAVLSALFTLSARYLFLDTVDRDKHFLQELLFSPLTLVAFVFFGLFPSPLADLVSLYFLVYSLSCVKLAYTRLSATDGKVLPTYLPTYLLFMLAGAFAYIAYNTRTIYMASGWGIIAIVLLMNKNYFLIFTSLLIGVFSVGWLQSVVNYHHNATRTIALVNMAWAGHYSLNLFQLYHGVILNFYETYVGGTAGAAFGYASRAGEQLFASAGITEPFQSYAEYFALFLRYPVDMLASVFRNFLLLLNPISGEGYIATRSNMRFVYTVFNFTLLSILFQHSKLIFLDRTFKETWADIKAACAGTSVRWLATLTIILPFVAIVPGAVEGRFGLPFWVVAYAVICYQIDFKSIWLEIRGNLKLHVCIYLFTLMVFVSILTELYAANWHGVFLPLLRFG